MTDDHTGRKAGRVCGAAVFALLLLLFLAVRTDLYYDLNDDTMIKDILSGAYTGVPSGYCIQILYPLAGLIALFYRAIPAVPWYGLFLCLCQFGVLFLAALRLICMTDSLRIRLMALGAEAALMLGLFLREFMIIQYSVTSGLCMAGAVFLFLTAPQAEKVSLFLKANLVPLFLVVLSFMIRTEVCIMLLPFLLLSGLARWCGEERFFTWTNIRKYMALLLSALLFMTIAYSLNMLAYRGSEWSRFRDLFDARTKLYDFYGIPPYEENKAFYGSIGLSGESCRLLENYNLALDESIDTWRLEAIAQYQAQKLHHTFGFISKNSIREALWLYKEHLMDSLRAVTDVLLRGSAEGLTARMVAGMAVVAAYVLYLITCIAVPGGRARAKAIMLIVCLVLIRGILWTYLYMVDRVLDRVAMPLLMLELITLIGLMHMNGPVRKENKITHAIYIACIFCALLAFGGNVQRLRAEYAGRAVADERWYALMDHCRENGDDYYVVDVYSSTSYNGIAYSEKIFEDVDDSFKNYDVCGGWAAKSPLARQKLERYQFRDVQHALYDGKGSSAHRAYFVQSVDKELDWLVRYYGKRGLAVTPVRVGQICTSTSEAVFDVYELVRDTGI